MLIRSLALAAAASLATAVLAAPVTYQGRLDDAGAPANGPYDMEFALYDDLAPGAPDTLIETRSVRAVSVVDGLFTAEIPFGTFAFDGGPRFVEISVRPAGVGAYTALSPRQQLTDAPHARHAKFASSLNLPLYQGALPSSPGGAILTIENIDTTGIAISAAGPQWGAVGYGGDYTPYPPVAVPAGLAGVGEFAGTAGASGAGSGVWGSTISGYGGQFTVSNTNPGTALWAHTAGTGGAGLFEINSTTNTNPALLARTASTQDSTFAIHGILDAATAGIFAAAVRGESHATNGFFHGVGVWGSHADAGIGVYGTAVSGSGVYGTSPSGSGVYGATNDGDAIHGLAGGSGRAGLFEIVQTNNGEAVILARTVSELPNAFGVHAVNEATSQGANASAVYGENMGTGPFGVGVRGTQAGAGWGVHGASFGGGYGVCGTSNGSGGVGVYGSGVNGARAGFFNGDVHVTGTLSKSSGTFKIDHPLDPANKYLSHSFVESPDMKNIYDGVTTLDADGRAEIVLPDYFQALNENFRYQLTCLGGHAPVYIGREISANTFTIAGGNPGLRVSWQVTGSRKDAFARTNPIVVEEDKPADERGKYLTPEAHGKPAELGIGRHPQTN